MGLQAAMSPVTRAVRLQNKVMGILFLGICFLFRHEVEFFFFFLSVNVIGVEKQNAKELKLVPALLGEKHPGQVSRSSSQPGVTEPFRATSWVVSHTQGHQFATLHRSYIRNFLSSQL